MHTTPIGKSIEVKLILMDELWKYEAEGWQIDREKPMPHVSLGGWMSVYVFREGE